jgi:hypothetical protein
MKTVFRIDVPDQRKQLIIRVGGQMGIEKYRGYVLFDDSDYADYPNPKWRKRALHLDVRRGVEEISPEHIVQLISSPDCDHFVWLSKRIVESELVHMVWVYAHELRHVIQDTLYPELSEMTGHLRKRLQDRYAIEMPQEYDAELAARDIVVQFFGEEEYQAYRCREAARDSRATEYHRKFDELASNWTGDLIAETRRIILSLE